MPPLEHPSLRSFFTCVLLSLQVSAQTSLPQRHSSFSFQIKIFLLNAVILYVLPLKALACSYLFVWFFFSINISVLHLTVNSIRIEAVFAHLSIPGTEQGLAHTGGTHRYLKDNWIKEWMHAPSLLEAQRETNLGALWWALGVWPEPWADWEGAGLEGQRTRVHRAPDSTSGTLHKLSLFIVTATTRAENYYPILHLRELRLRK